MDYEKKYRDLVEAVKELQEANPHDEGIQKWVEDNVPELKESIVDNNKTMLNACINTLRNVGHSHLATWLEKQKPMEDFNGDDYGIDSLWHAIRILEKTLGEVEGYQTDDGILEHKCAITAVRKLAKERRERKSVEEIKGVSHKWYMCIEGVENFSKGCLYVSNIDDQGTEWITDDTGHSFVYGYYLRYFRPATEKEIPYKPEFKVGDWITNGELLVGQVLSFDGEYYHYICDGIEQPLHISNAYNWHLWTIQDAKAGDVLFHSDSASNGIFIFKELLKCGFSEEVICYCDYDSEDGFCLGDHHTCCWADAKILHPATKEQRNTLFAKMKEAGYEWDAEKKELKEALKEMQKPTDKVEPFDKYEGLTDFERALTDICMGWIGEEHGWKQYIKDNADVLLRIAVKMFNSVQDAPFEQKPTETVKWSPQEESCICQLESLVKKQWRQAERAHNSVNIKKMSELMFFLKTLNPNKKPQRIISAEAKEAMYNKPAWSEEDELALKQAIYVCHQNGYTAVENWLKSLKDRVGCEVNCTTTKEWSEEDVKMIEDAIYSINFESVAEGLRCRGIKHSCDMADTLTEKLHNWLKSLRPQNRWKPNDAQMEALESATENCAYSEYQDCLRELIEQLKKLREE